MTADFPTLGKKSAGWRATAALAGLMPLATLLAAITAVAFVWFALPHLPAAWQAAVNHRGLGKVMVRAMQLWLVLLLPLLLRFSGWRGRRDCGWQNEVGVRRSVGRDVFNGLVIGLVSLGGLALFMLATSRRWLCVLEADANPLGAIFGFTLSAAVVAVFEETLARGIIFRLWARAWGAVAAALVSSLLFAGAHFLEPAVSAFEKRDFWGAVWSLAGSALALDTTDPAFLIRFLNLVCLGLVLCAMVRLTGNIWLAVGAHAGWVWIIKVHNFFTDAVPPPLRDGVWGARGDLTDSWAGTAALLVVLLGVCAAQWRRRQLSVDVGIARRGVLIATGALLALAGTSAVVIQTAALPKRWGVVEAGVLFRSGQLAPPVAWKLLRAHQIVAVLDLSDQSSRTREQEIWMCRHLGIKHVSLPLAGDGTGDLAHYADALNIMADALRSRHPVLVHCTAGTQRTGGVVAAFRLLIQGADAKTTLAELERYGWRPEKNPALLPFLEKNLPAIAQILQERGVPVHDRREPLTLQTP